MNRITNATIAATSIAAAALLSACGGSDGRSGSGSIDLAGSFESAAVCNGEPSSVNPPSTEPFSGYVYLTTGDGWTTGWSGAFGDRHAIVGDDATSIMCASVTSTTEAERCDYEEEGETFTLVMVAAEYDITLRSADTASPMTVMSFSVPAEECPFITSWTEGEGERTSFPTPSEDQIASAISPFVN